MKFTHTNKSWFSFFTPVAATVLMPFFAHSYEPLACSANQVQCTSGERLPSVEFCLDIELAPNAPVPAYLTGPITMKGYQIPTTSAAAHLDATDARRGIAFNNRFNASIDLPQEPGIRTRSSLNVMVECKFPRQ